MSFARSHLKPFPSGTPVNPLPMPAPPPERVSVPLSPRIIMSEDTLMKAIWRRRGNLKTIRFPLKHLSKPNKIRQVQKLRKLKVNKNLKILLRVCVTRIILKMRHLFPKSTKKVRQNHIFTTIYFFFARKQYQFLMKYNSSLKLYELFKLISATLIRNNYSKVT